MTRSFLSFAKITALILLISSFSIPVSRATDLVNYSATLYVDAPKVQASYLATADNTENFNRFKSGDCPETITIGTVVKQGGSGCDFGIEDNLSSLYGGATTLSDTPTTYTESSPGTQTPFGYVEPYKKTVITFTPRKYLGFWWSAGSSGNKVSFYSDSTLVASMTAEQFQNFLAKGQTLTTKGGSSTYSTNDYWGHPSNGGAKDNGEPFAYLHIFTSGDQTFNKIAIEQTNNTSAFEFDNLTISDSPGTPRDQLVFLANLYTHQIKFDPKNGEPIIYKGSIHLGDTVLTPPEPTVGVEGKHFVGWQLNSNDIVQGESNITLDSNNENYIYNAIWINNDLRCSTNDYSKINESRATPIFLDDGKLIGTGVILGDDYQTDNIDIGFKLNDSDAANSRIKISTNGTILLNGLPYGIYNADLVTREQNGSQTEYKRNNSSNIYGVTRYLTGNVDSDYLSGICKLDNSHIIFGNTTIAGDSAFVVTWYRIKSWKDTRTLGTFQVAIIKTGAGFKFVRNYESIITGIGVDSPYNLTSLTGPYLFTSSTTLSGEDTNKVFAKFSNLNYPSLFDDGINSLSYHSYHSSGVLGRYVIEVPLPTYSYTLTYSSGAGGSVSPSSLQTILEGENGTAVTATANSGFRFLKWSDEVTDNPRIDSNISENLNVMAIFSAISPCTSENLGSSGTSILKFTNTSNCAWIVPTGIDQIEYLIVGGGGGGGQDAAGGGAGGSVLADTITVSSGEILEIIIGSGGAGGTPSHPIGYSGTSSRIKRSGIDLEALGGSGGGNCNYRGFCVSNSGGSNGTEKGKGGNGGYRSADLTPPLPGTDGTLSSISGIDKTYGSGGGGGGGAGGIWCIKGLGGKDSGGNGFDCSSGVSATFIQATSAPRNLGGGGGGGGDVGGAGADGVVYLKYLNKFKVTYDGNLKDAGSAPIDNNFYNFGATVSILGNSGNLKRANKEFIGWNTNSDGSGTKYLETDSLVLTENLTLYAMWKTVELAGGGGLVPPFVEPKSVPNNSTVIEIPEDTSSPVVINPPSPLPGLPAPKPERKITVSKQSEKTVITIAPKPNKPVPTINNSSSDITIVGLSKNQRIKVTLFDLNGGKKEVSVTNESQVNNLVNSNPKSTVQIEIVPTLSQELQKGAQISIKGAKKNQRVRVTVKTVGAIKT